MTVDYEAIREDTKSAIQHEDSAALVQLIETMQSDTNKRTITQNFIYLRALGALESKQGRAQEAFEAYQEAYHLDSRDRLILDALAERFFSGDLSDEDGLLVLQRLLIFHLSALPSETVGRIYRTLGERSQTQGDMRRAEMRYEKALEAEPGNVDTIRCFLGVMQVSEDPDEARAVRERLISSLSRPEERATVLVIIGDDLRAESLDEAISNFERALTEHPRSETALSRLRGIGLELEDWERVARTTTSLAILATDLDAKLALFEEAAEIYQGRLGATKKAVLLYNQVLDIDPMHAEAFQRIHDLLVEAKRWTRLERSYTKMTARLEPLDDDRATTLLLKLYPVLADIRLSKLEQPIEASKALEKLLALQPENLENIRALADIYIHFSEKLPEAQQAYSLLLRAERDSGQRLDLMEKLANIAERRREYDRAYCMYRVLDCYNRAEERSARFVRKVIQQRAWPVIKQPIDDASWRVISAIDPNSALSQLFILAHPALRECYRDDLYETYRLKPNRDHLDTAQPTLFSTAYLPIAEALGFEPAPRVYPHDQTSWLSNAYVSPASFLTSKGILSGRTLNDLGFICGKAFTLLRPEFYLIGRGDPIPSLTAVLHTLLKVFRPDVAGQLTDKNQQRIAKEIKRLDANTRQTMQQIIDAFIEQGAKVNVGRWVQQAEETANRVGFLFAEDLQAVAKVLLEETTLRGGSEETFNAQFTRIVEWSTTDAYIDLRARLGLDFSPS